MIAVRADNAKQPASRWYAGAGIYRHARLIVTDPVHLEQWATFVSTPKVSARRSDGQGLDLRGQSIERGRAPVTVEFAVAGQERAESGADDRRREIGGVRGKDRGAESEAVGAGAADALPRHRDGPRG